MPQKTEIMASRLVRDLYDVTAGRPMQWRAIGGMADGSDIEAAVQLAVQKGWMVLEGVHSVCLTDEGRKQVEYQSSPSTTLAFYAPRYPQGTCHSEDIVGVEVERRGRGSLA